MLEVRQVENQRELRIRVRPAILRFSFRRRAPAIKASRRIHRYIAITGFAALRQGLIRCRASAPFRSLRSWRSER